MMPDRFNLADAFARIREHWSPKIVGELNGQEVRLAKLLGSFVWHRHDAEDELFLVHRGRLRMEFRDHAVELAPGDVLIVPHGVEHRPVADEEVEVVLFEPATTLNTGNIRNERTLDHLERMTDTSVAGRPEVPDDPSGHPRGGPRVTYEITAIVRPDLRDAYEEYMLGRHIPDLLETGAFAAASIGRSTPGRYRVRYEAFSREALDGYLATHAAGLREHFAATFPEGIEVAREEWTLLSAWASP